MHIGVPPIILPKPIQKSLIIYELDQGDCREETRRAYQIPISAKKGPFGQPG